MKIGRSLLVTLASLVIIPFAAQSYMAEEICTHNWNPYNPTYESVSTAQHKESTTYYCPICDAEKTTETLENHAWEYSYAGNYKEISANQHSYDKEYYCSLCYQYKTDTVKEAHKWVLSEQYYGYDNIKSISAKQHSYISHYYCQDCYADKYPSATEAHNFDKYGVCTTCNYTRARTITLKSNSTVNVNQNTWMKVTVRKKGLLSLNINAGGFTNISLYNSKKAKFRSTYTPSKSGKIVIPVSKGTYYLKANDSDTIKYVFKSDPSKKNYTKNAAISLKRNKTYTTVIYSGDKKNTWNRYYKIKLTKKQRITILSSVYDGSIYDAKGNYISLSSYYDKNGNLAGYTTDRKLPKGTYYLCFGQYWTPVTRKQTTGSYITFKWK